MSATPDPDRGRCAWIAQGERCHYPGTMARSVRGTLAWHCRGHFQCSDQAEGQRIVEASRAVARPTDTATLTSLYDVRNPTPSRLPYIDE